MPKLTDTQLVILSTAARRDDGASLPLPKSLKLQGGAANHVMKSLVKKGLLQEQPAGRDGVAWRETTDGRRQTLVITDAGRAAIGIAADEQSESQPARMTPRGARRSAVRRRKANEPKSTTAPSSKAKRMVSPSALRSGTKLALLLDLLQRKEGASIAEAMKATGWQPHSVRGAISGALKKKLDLAVISDKVEGRDRVYRIAPKR
jgi:DNA-binding MarR family transcriptional regulator